MSGDEPRFLVDGMLGSVARFLRLLGYDTAYYSDAPDTRLISLALRESRILVTGDRELYARAVKTGAKAILVHGSKEEVLAEIFSSLGLAPSFHPSSLRCPLCNSKLISVDRERVKNMVPPRVYARQSRFWICPKCGKVYWVGGHWASISRSLRKVAKLLDLSHQ